MAELNLRLDMDRIQSSVQASVRPAVQAALEKIDVAAIIEKELTRKPPKNEMGEFYARMGYSSPARPLIDEMVEEAIHAVAKEYVEAAVRNQRDRIEDALHAMMLTSTKKIVKQFATAIQRGLESEWNFDLDVKVTAKQPERADD